MFKRVFCLMATVLLVLSTSALSCNIRCAKADLQPVYINADGSITPSSAPIQSDDNITYKLIGNVSYPNYTSIVVERSNIVIDGNGWTIEGTQSSTALAMNGIANVTIRNTSINGFEYGIDLESSTDIIVSGNTLVGNTVSVNVGNSFGITVIGNKITVNPGEGVELVSSSRCTIIENNITSIYLGIAWEPYMGIWLMSSMNNTLSKNSITYENWGIALHGSSFNTVFDNSITENDCGIVIGVWWSGLDVGKCVDNEIYNNNFMHDTQNVLSGSSISFWDNGYTCGGNFWSDYNQADVYSGFYQNVTGSDKIGDHPYVMDENNTDRYPLVYLSECYKPGYISSPDMNKDGVVNIVDVTKVASAFASMPGDSNWNALADMDLDEIINMVDITIIAKDYRKTASR